MKDMFILRIREKNTDMEHLQPRALAEQRCWRLALGQSSAEGSSWGTLVHGMGWHPCPPSHQGSHLCRSIVTPTPQEDIFIIKTKRTRDLTDHRSNKERFSAAFRSFFPPHSAAWKNLSFQAAACWAQVVSVRKGREGFPQQHEEIRPHLGTDPW